MNNYYQYSDIGSLVFDPKEGTKHFDPWWALILCDEEIIKYYSWFLKKRGIPVVRNGLWGCHISVIKGEEPLNKETWGQTTSIEFWYSNTIRWDNNFHAWIDIFCPDMNSIRQNMGLPIRSHFHMTLGRLT